MKKKKPAKKSVQKKPAAKKKAKKAGKAIVLYLPVIHAGYVEFFRKHGGHVYIIGPDFHAEFPKIERDIRMLPPEMIIQGLFGIVEGISILSRKNIAALPQEDEIIIPDDEISRGFAEKYLGHKKISIQPAFLRWNRIITTSEFVIPPDRTVSRKEFDREMIALANIEAAKSADWWRQIGAVLVREGKSIVATHNHHLPTRFGIDVFGDPRSNFDAGEKLEKKLGGMDITPNELGIAIHAEAAVVARAAKEGIAMDGATLYVSTFPCPNCARLIAEAGIKKVYYQKGYSLLDAEKILKAYEIEIILVD